jgi:hypothetical protein
MNSPNTTVQDNRQENKKSNSKQAKEKQNKDQQNLELTKQKKDKQNSKISEEKGTKDEVVDEGLEAIKTLIDFLGIKINITKNKFSKEELYSLMKAMKNSSQSKYLIFSSLLMYLVQLSQKHNNKIPNDVLETLVKQGCTEDTLGALYINIIQNAIVADVKNSLDHKKIFQLAKSKTDFNNNDLNTGKNKGRKYIIFMSQIISTEEGKINKIKQLIKEGKTEEIDELIQDNSTSMLVSDLVARLSKHNADLYQAAENAPINTYVLCPSELEGVQHTVVFKVLNKEEVTYKELYAEISALHQAYIEVETTQIMQRLIANTLTGLFGAKAEQV